MKQPRFPRTNRRQFLSTVSAVAAAQAWRGGGIPVAAAQPAAAAAPGPGKNRETIVFAYGYIRGLLQTVYEGDGK